MLFIYQMSTPNAITRQRRIQLRDSLVRIRSLRRRHKLHVHFRNILEVARRVQIQIGGVGHDDESYGTFNEQRRSR